MLIPEEIFRAYDIRGTMDQLSPELARRVGMALVTLTGAKSVVVGRDMRETSPLFAASAIEAIRSMGVNVVDIGMCSTPLFNFAVSHYPEHEAGLMVTASHNPSEYNGFKMMHGNALPVSGEEMKEPVLHGTFQTTETLGALTERDVRGDYVDQCFALAHPPSLSGMKIVVDAGNGMAGVTLPQVFERLDVEMTPLFFEPDGTFPNHEANPVKEETLEAMREKMREVGAHVGVALDGDADRIVFLDEKGQSMRGDAVLSLFSTTLLPEAGGGSVVYSPNASWVIPETVTALGGEPVLSKVGHANIKRKMAETKALLGGEVSGHFFFRAFANLEASDYAMLLFFRILRESGKPLSELIAPYRDRYVSTGELNFKVEDKASVLKHIEERYTASATLVNRLDGLRVEFEDWWFNVRASNTEPLLRLTMEAKSPERLEEKRAEIIGVIQA